MHLTNGKLKFVLILFSKIPEDTTCVHVDSFVISPPPELKVELLAHAEQNYEEEGNARGERAIRCEHLEGLQYDVY